MSFIKRLFRGPQTASPSTPRVQSASSVFSSASTVSPSEFPSHAAWSHANCVVPISEIADLIRSLDTALMSKGMSMDTMQDLCFFSLIGLCPQCGNPCGPDALQSFVLFKALGGANNVMFTGQSGGGDRLIRGQCRNTSCSSRDMQIFWCPDIDPDAVAYFKSRGLELKDRSTKREGVWPLSNKKTATAPTPPAPPPPTVRRPPSPQSPTTPAAVQQLLRKDVDVNAAGKDGITPLMAFSGIGDAGEVKLLLAAGANVSATNIDGKTPLMIASQEGHADVAKLLLAARANVNADRKGVTPLMMAGGHASVIQLLKTAGAKE
jgi:Ankyrin repeats (3 copies)